MIAAAEFSARSPGGLTSQEAAAIVARVGPNDLAPRRSASSPAAWLLRLVLDPMVLLLVIAAGTYAMLGDRFDAAVTAVAVLPIFLVGGVLEWRSERALERLSELAPPRARVLRDRRVCEIPAVDVVPGDVLFVREGDVIAADATLCEAASLQVDESALTGESLPVHKTPDQSSEMRRILAGTIVRSGRGVAIVDATGRHTQYGNIGATMARMRDVKAPIERAIHRIVVQVSVGVAAICVIVIGIGHLHGDPWPIAVIAGVSLAMAAIPEELPMVYTLYLALGAWRLARDHALVRKLAKVETLGSVNVICLDKTGTMTHGTLEVEGIYAVEGATADDVLRLATIASDGASGDPLDEVILAVAARTGQSAAPQHETLVPFDPARRYAGAIFSENGTHRLVLKGALEALSPRVIASNGAESGLRAWASAAAARGSRVLAVATAKVRDGALRHAHEAVLELAGLIAFSDPVRAELPAVVASCREAGVRVVVITGDHPETACAIARQAGLDGKHVLTGHELDRLDDDRLAECVGSVAVFARIRPEQKLRIVRALHARGDVVAMTGDGTNDALAMREADIGIAMGKRGTEVARAAADLVLLNDDVTTIVSAIADGRRIFHNLRHAFSYLNAFHLPLLLSAFILPLLGAPLLLMPIHLIWLELIVHPTSALVFENDPRDETAMHRPPRAAGAPLLRREDYLQALALGTTLSIAVLGIYAFLLHGGYHPDAARAASITAMISGQCLLVLVERAGFQPLWRVRIRDNRTILPILGGTMATVAAAVYLPAVARLVHFAAVPPLTLLACVSVALASVLWLQPFVAVGARRGA